MAQVMSAPGWAPVRARAQRVSRPVLGVVGVIALWELLTEPGMLGPSVPTLRSIAASLVAQASGGELWTRLGETLWCWFLGLAIAAVAGVVLGVLLGMSRFASDSVSMLLEFLRPIPSVAIIPLAVLVLGTDARMKVSLIVFATLWPVLYNTLYGIRDIDPLTLDMARSYQLSALRTQWVVVIRGALPYVFTGLRVAATIALIVELATELIAGSTGLGYLLNELQEANNVPGSYAVVIVAGVVGVVVTHAAHLIERRSLYWHHSQREATS